VEHARIPIQGEALIRDCTEDDLAELIWYSRGGAGVVKERYLRWAFEKAARGEGVFLAARFRDLAFGRCQLHWRSTGNPHLADGATSAELDDLFVHSPFRGFGVGRALVRTCIGLSDARGLRYLRVGVQASNARAIDLYTSEGFVDGGPGMLRWQDWSMAVRIMERDLRA